MPIVSSLVKCPSNRGMAIAGFVGPGLPCSRVAGVGSPNTPRRAGAPVPRAMEPGCRATLGKVALAMKETFLEPGGDFTAVPGPWAVRMFVGLIRNELAGWLLPERSEDGDTPDRLTACSDPGRLKSGRVCGKRRVRVRPGPPKARLQTPGAMNGRSRFPEPTWRARRDQGQDDKTRAWGF